MLPLVALLLVGMMAIATLAIDLGLAAMSQASMQVAADGAAMEGLRLRDDAPGDPAGSDALRRQAAATLVRRLYDDDLLATATDPVHFGAGPDLTVVSGASAVPGASGLLVVGPEAAWKPQLQENLDNLAYGDFVAGTYDPGALHDEGGDYARADFAVADAADAPGANAFLARLRRTNDPLGLDAQDGTSSSGPALPLLFGHGAFLHGDGGGYDPAVDGLTVRATAIATARPAIAVGPAGVSAGEGAVPWELQRDFWEALPSETPVTLDLDADSGAITVPSGGAQVGSACALLLAAGQPVVAAAAGPLPIDGWIGVSSDTVDGVVRAVGFGRASLSMPSTGSILVVKHAGMVAPENASGVATALVPLLPPDALQTLFTLVASLPLDPEGGYVLAPVLAR